MTNIFLSNSVKLNVMIGLRADSRQLLTEGTFDGIERNVPRFWKHLQRGVANVSEIIGTHYWNVCVNFRVMISEGSIL